MSKKKREMHPNSLANLEKGKWGKVESGNPNGRRKSILNQIKYTLSLGEGEEISGALDLSYYKKISLWLMEFSQGELSKLIKVKDTPAFIVLLARSLQKDMAKGTMWAFDNIFKKFLEEDGAETSDVLFVTGFDIGDNNPPPMEGSDMTHNEEEESENED